jgi:hypothetical protein
MPELSLYLGNQISSTEAINVRISLVENKMMEFKVIGRTTGR